MRTGQVIGSTDKQAAEPNDRPVRFKEVHATLCNLFTHRRSGIRLPRPAPVSVPPETKPLKELV